MTINFIAGTVVPSSWLNDVNNVIYNGLGASNVPAASIIKNLQSGTGAVARTVQSKFTDMISVMDFGAVGDGTTDDTTALQAAITYADTINKALYWPIPPGGFYKTLLPLNVGNACHWIGESNLSCIIRNKVGSGAVLSFAGGDGAGPYQISNIKLGGSGCVAIQLAGGGYTQYVPRLNLNKVHFESDLLQGINANLIFFVSEDTWYGYAQESGVNASFQAIVSASSGGRNTNLNLIIGGGIYNSPGIAVSLSGGITWRFENVDFENNVTNLRATNIQDITLQDCYSERGKPAAFQGMYQFITNRTRAKVLGGSHSQDSSAVADSAIISASSDAKVFIEDCDLTTSSIGFLYYNSSTVSHSLTNDGLHNFQDIRIQGNAGDPLLWMDNIVQGAPQTWTPSPNSLTVVNGTGGATYAGTWTKIHNRQIEFTIRISLTGTCTTASTAATSYFQLPSQFLPQVAHTCGAVNMVNGASLGVGLTYTNGRVFLPAWGAQTGDVTISGVFNY